MKEKPDAHDQFFKSIRIPEDEPHNKGVPLRVMKPENNLESSNIDAAKLRKDLESVFDELFGPEDEDTGDEDGSPA